MFSIKSFIFGIRELPLYSHVYYKGSAIETEYTTIEL